MFKPFRLFLVAVSDSINTILRLIFTNIEYIIVDNQKKINYWFYMINKLFNIYITTFLCVIFSLFNVSAYAAVNKKSAEPAIVYDFSTEKQTLKFKEIRQVDQWGEVEVSYIVKFHYKSHSDFNVSVKFLDSEGFEIVSRSIGTCSKGQMFDENLKYELKGRVFIPLNRFQITKGAELEFTTPI